MSDSAERRIPLACAPEGRARTEIVLGPGVFDASAQAGDDFLLVDACLPPLHGAVRETLAAAGSRALEIPAGEGAKSMARLDDVLRSMARSGLDRASRLVALGGGSIGDLGGLAAALYMRGIAFEQVPTTLLSMVDSSVGGKTAVNLPEAKNLVGAFWPAQRVLVDPRFLGTLDEAEYRSGLGEVLKIAIGLDEELFTFCERERDRIRARDTDALTTVIERALRAKIRVVEADFLERDARRLLNLGHTLGHALESARRYEIPHGAAVARGIHYVLDLADRRGDLDAASAARCRALLETFGFERDPLEDRTELEPFLRRDKKRVDDALGVVLPTGIGESTVTRMSIEEFTRLLPGA